MSADNADGKVTTIEIETLDLPIAFKMKDDPPKGVSVVVPPIVRMRESYGGEDLIRITLTVAKDVGVGIVSAWLYDKFKSGRSPTIRINRREIEVENDKIARIIDECITESDRKGPEE